MKGILQNRVYAAAVILVHRPCNPGSHDATHDVVLRPFTLGNWDVHC